MKIRPWQIPEQHLVLELTREVKQVALVHSQGVMREIWKFLAGVLNSPIERYGREGKKKQPSRLLHR